MRDGVDLIKFDGNHLCEPILISVVYDATTLDDVDCLVRNKTLCCPSRVVRVGEMVTVENGGNVSTGVQGKEKIQIVGFRFRADNFDDSEHGIGRFHFEQLRLERFDWFGSVVDKADTKLVSGVD